MADAADNGDSPLKCSCCGSSFSKNSDDLKTPHSLCDRCRDNIDRRKFYENLKKPRQGICEDDLVSRFTEFCDEKDHFKPALAANYVKRYFKFKTDRASDILYRYDDKKNKWAAEGETYLKELLSKLLDQENRPSHYNNVLHDLKSITYEDIQFSKKIACSNWLLDVETGEISDFTCEEMPFYSINVAYDPEAECPKWKAYLPKAVEPEDIPKLQEWSGYLLLPDYLKHKIMWMYGVGRNGKGVWTRTMEGILGPDNCSSVSLEEFNGDRRFSLYQLRGSLFNPCSEPATNRILQTQVLKKITGQDTIDAEIKGKQQRVKFRNVAKVTVIGNRYPRINDTTTAFWDRVELLSFPFQYTGKEQIDNLENVWLSDAEERSGILNWMLEGLHRLLSNGDFTRSKTQEDTKIQFKRVSDSVGAFIDEDCTFGQNLVTTRSEAYDHYKEYCDLLGAPVENDRIFTQRVKNTPRIKQGFVRVGGKLERAWLGVGIKPISESATDATLATDSSLLDNLPIEKIGKVKECVADVANVAKPSITTEKTISQPDRTCGNCLNHWKPSCEKDNFGMILPTATYAGTCKAFVPKQSEATT